MRYTKNCPKCGRLQTYNTEKGLKRALKADTKCKKCSVFKLSKEEAHKRLLERVKKYQKDNKDIIKAKKKLYRQKHKNKIKKYNKRYADKNKDKIKIYQEKYMSKISSKEKRRMWDKKHRGCPIIRIGESISSCIRASLKTNNLSKNSRHWEEVVGYTIQKLKEYIETLFQPGMTWNNQGRNGWVVDHIIPRKFFNYKSIDDVEFKYCWSLDNLQPLWKADNKDKSDKIILWGKEIRARDFPYSNL